MFLKSLTLKGFKSFAEATTLEFEPGVTVVVGPNGSGKSNIVDAIGWVLGAQAPSAVRSQKMDDVIFAGTATRPPLGRAEAALTIDNSGGLLAIDFTEVTVSRTLFRSGDSEYAINGVPCRLLDLQDLLSDTGVGRQQHTIVSQGQIDAVLNAKPDDRRLIVEEAAGILKYRKRKEKAERRLAATEGNLTRLQDLLREVRRQLRPLERQADAARRHGDLVAELRALRTHLAGRELATVRARLEKQTGHQRDLSSAEAAHTRSLTELDTAVLAAESELAAMGGDDLGDALVRFDSLRERARGLGALLAERRRGIERERAAFVDQTVVATLEAEAHRLRAELAHVEAEAATVEAEAALVAAAESDLDDSRTRFRELSAEGAPAATGAAEVRGELAALSAAVARGAPELDRSNQRLATIAERKARLTEECDACRSELTSVAELAGPVADALADAERRRLDAEQILRATEQEFRSVEAGQHRWEARAEALAQALDAARAAAGAQRLAGIDGVVGTLLDLVEIDTGYEAAFESAAGEALTAVVVDSVDAGRRALMALRQHDVAGAVLPLLAAPNPRPFLPSRGEPLRQYVRSGRADVERLLDALIGSTVVVDGGWSSAVDVALTHPGSVVVTRKGDRFGMTGWRVGATGVGATGAALDEARRRTAEAAELLDAVGSRLAEADESLRVARQREHDVVARRDECDARRTAAADALTRAESAWVDLVEGDELTAQRDERQASLDRDRARVADLQAQLPALVAEETQAAERVRSLAAARTQLDDDAAAVAARRTEFEVRAAALDERRRNGRLRVADIDERLERHAAAREAAEERRIDLGRQALAVERLAALVTDRAGVVDAELAAVHERRRRQSEAACAVATRLDQLRRARADEERSREETRERRRRAELETAETRLRLEQAVETCRRDLDCEPDQAMAASCPPLPEGVSPHVRVRELEREVRLMGPINPLALEEFQALQERHEFLVGQLDDVKSTRRELAKVIRAVNEEIVSVFAAAYADVADNFTRLFEMLFPGGWGRLALTEPDNLLETGVEIEARPSGKNVKKLSLLSGGERSLTALAFLFAVFRSRPSPFYVMDEVEAALDDVNLHRFLDLVHEFRRDAQLLIVSHQKRTMEAADSLYGVTMQSGGSSKVISERVSAHA